MTELPEVLTRDISSGKIHRRVQVPGGYASLEADNLDTAGEFEMVTSEQLSNAEPGDLCERCFPPVGEPEMDSSSGSPDPS
jgi:hypothetical protein